MKRAKTVPGSVKLLRRSNSTYSDLETVFLERFKRTLLHIINQPIFINDSNWVNILNHAVVAYDNNLHSTIAMTPVDASNNHEKVIY